MTSRTTTSAEAKRAAAKPTRSSKMTVTRAAKTKSAAKTKPAANKKTPVASGHVRFTRLQIKLMVIDKLMEDGVIPPFQLEVVEKAVGKKLYDGANGVMPENDFWGMQPEVRDWFWHYPVKPAWLASIESLSWGAGAPTMDHVAPNWGGESALFDVTADDAADLELLPSLTSIRASFDRAREARIVAAFAARGVELKYYFG